MKRDLRKYAQQTNARLVAGFFILLLVVGIGLIYAFYGRDAALMGLLCVGAALAPAGLVALILAAIGWFVKRVDQG